LKIKDNKKIENKSLSDVENILAQIKKFSSTPGSLKTKHQLDKIFLNNSIGCLKEIQKKKNFSS